MKLKAQIENAIKETHTALQNAKKNEDIEMIGIYRGYIDGLSWVLESREIKDSPSCLPYIPIVK